MTYESDAVSTLSNTHITCNMNILNQRDDDKLVMKLEMTCSDILLLTDENFTMNK